MKSINTAYQHLLETADTLGDQNVRFVARWKAGVQIGLLGEVTYYT